LHLIGADMLGDTASFAFGDARLTNGIEQRCLAVVDVTHHSDDRRARREIGRIVGNVEQTLLDVGFRHAAYRVTHFLGNERRGVGVDHVGDRQHLPLLHEQLDHVDAALGHAAGEILDADRLRDRHLADQLLLGLAGGLALQALSAAAERRYRTLALFVGTKRGDDGEAPALLLGARTRRGGWPRGCGTCGAAATARTRRFFLFGFEHAAASRRGRRTLALVFAEALFGDLVGLAFGLFVVAAALFLVAFAHVRSFALGALGRFAAGAAARLFLGDLALFDLAHARVGERAGARGTFIFGQRAQHDAGLRRRRGRCRSRRGGGCRGLAGGCGRSGGALFGDLGRRGRRRGFADDATLHLLDGDLLAAAMAEALAHGPLLDAGLERQRFRADAQFLVARGLRFTHSCSSPRALSGPAFSPDLPSHRDQVRKRS